MSEGLVTVTINGTDYPMACQPGEEAKVRALGAQIDSVVKEVAAGTGPIGEARLLVMATLIIADSLAEMEKDAKPQTSPTPSPTPSPQTSPTPEVLPDDETNLIARIENLAHRLEKLALPPD